MPATSVRSARHSRRPSDGLTFLQALLLLLSAVVGLMPHGALLRMLLQLLGRPTLAPESATPVSAWAGQVNVSHPLAEADKHFCRMLLQQQSA